MKFIKFPTTPHIEEPPGGIVRGDKLVDDLTRRRLLTHPVIVEEKVDGANVGIWFNNDGTMRLQNRGELIGASAHPQFNPLKAWAAARQFQLRQTLSTRYILFGEWCFARHTVYYDRLPDYFLGFDLFDREKDCFLSLQQRNTVFKSLEIARVPQIFSGVLGTVEKLNSLLCISMVGSEPMEGLYIRYEHDQCLVIRAKYVRKSFIQPDDIHWSKRTVEPNRLGLTSGQDASMSVTSGK